MVNIIDLIKRMLNKLSQYNEGSYLTKTNIKNFYSKKDITDKFGVTAESGWTIVNKNITLSGNLLTVYLVATHNAKIAAGAISNLKIATFNIKPQYRSTASPITKENLPILIQFRGSAPNSTYLGPNVFFTNVVDNNTFSVALSATHAAIAANKKINTTLCFPVVIDKGVLRSFLS